MSGTLSVADVRMGDCSRLSHVTCTHDKRDKPFPEVHERGTWTFALVRRGTFAYRSSASNRAPVLRPGWLLVGTPEAEFECSHDRDGGDECASLAISDDALRDVARGLGVAIEKLLPAAPALPPIPRVAALIEHARVREAADLDEAAYSVAESIAEYASGRSAADHALHAAHVHRVHDVMDRIERSCQGPISLAELADSAGLSRFHFLRVFRRVTGTTPHQYLIGARLRLAARFLLDTRRPVTEIAYDVGFQDLSNFIRTFRRVIGTSPREYRSR